MARKGFAGSAVPTTITGSILSTDTSFTIASATGWTFSATPFVVVIDRGTPSEEKILCSAIDGSGNVTVATRGYDGTSAYGHATGSTVLHVLDSITIDEVNDHVNTTTRDDHTQYLRTDGTRASTGAQVFSAGIGVGGSISGVYTNEIQFAGSGAGGSYALTSQATGAAQMYFDFRGTGNTGTWFWRNGSAAGTTRMSLTAAGLLTVTGGLATSAGNITAAVGGFFTSGPGGTARIYFKATDAPTDDKVWDVYPAGAQLYFRLINDAESSAANWLQVNRSGMTPTGFQAQGADFYLGTWAMSSGTNVSRLHLSVDAGAVYLTAEGDGADRHLIYSTKGAGSHQWYAGANHTASLSAGGQLLILGNDSAGNELQDWPNSSFAIRRSDNFVSNGITMISLGYRSDPLSFTDDSVPNIRIYDLSQGASAATSAATTDLRIGSPGAIWLGAGNSPGLVRLSTDGSFRSSQVDFYTGAYAHGAGTTVSRLHVQSTTTGVILYSEGDGADRDLVLRQKGAGVFKFQTSAGVTGVQITSGGTIYSLGTDAWIGPYAMGTGTSVSVFHVDATSGSAVTLTVGGDGSNVGLSYDTKGSAAHTWKVGGTSYAVLNGSGYQVNLPDFYIGTYALGSGTTVARLHLTATGGTNTTIAAEGDGANVQITYNTKGVGSHIWQVGAVSKMTLDSSGQINALGPINKFGRGAMGGSGVAVALSEDGTNVFVNPAGTPADIDMIFRPKGTTTGAVRLQTSGGGNILIADKNSHVLTGGTAPTTSGRHSDFSSATVTGNDTSGRVALPSIGSPTNIAAGTSILHVIFANAYFTAPTVNLQSQDGAASVAFGPGSVSTTGFDIVTQAAWTPTGSLTYTIGWHTIGY